jgi:hypothetical protein
MPMNAVTTHVLQTVLAIIQLEDSGVLVELEENSKTMHATSIPD